MADRYDLRLPAIEITQGNRKIYTFAVDGKLIHDFATVSRVHRDQTQLRGYQRPEVQSHIRAIRRYLESDGAMLPNAIVFAFDERVKFVSNGRSRPTVGYAHVGELVIPVDENLDEAARPALLVDGQQRSAAVRDADLLEFPVAAVGFIATGEDDQRSQFILVNNTKPLPKGLIHELLPETAGHLPPRYARRRLPAELMTCLNIDDDSPFAGLIATPTAPDGYIKDNSVLKMIENSLYEGALYQYRDPTTGGGDMRAMLLHLKAYWNLVQATWPEVWSKPPRQSRLTHGVGIQAMGYVMDALTEGRHVTEFTNRRGQLDLTVLKHATAWTGGSWRLSDGQELRWNSLQNTPNDIRLLSAHLIETIRG